MEELKEYVINYVKSRDAFYKKLVSYSEENDKVVFEFKDKNKTYYINEELSIPNINEHDVIVCLAKKENLKFLIDNWNTLISKSCLVMFVDLENHINWSINPHIHQKICDEESLAMGLETMYFSHFQSQTS